MILSFKKQIIIRRSLLFLWGSSMLLSTKNRCRFLAVRSKLKFDWMYHLFLLCRYTRLVRHCCGQTELPHFHLSLSVCLFMCVCVSVCVCLLTFSFCPSCRWADAIEMVLIYFASCAWAVFNCRASAMMKVCERQWMADTCRQRRSL